MEIEGFDEIMFLLQDALKLRLLDKDIVDIAQSRAKNYQDTVIKIRNEQAKSLDADVQKAAERIVEKVDNKDWWSWDMKAQAAKTNEEKQAIYLDGLQKLPNSAEMKNSYGNFLWEVEKGL